LDWVGGIRTADGVARPFEQGVINACTRLLVVPYIGDDRDGYAPQPLATSDWTSPAREWRLQAELSWPDAPTGLDHPAFDSLAMRRLRLAGISP